MNSLALPTVLGLIFLLAGGLPSCASSDAKEAANRLLVSSIKVWNEAQSIEANDPNSFKQRLDLIDTSYMLLKEIVSEYDGTDLAVRLITGEQIGPLSLPIVERAHWEATQSHELEKCVQGPVSECSFALALELAQTIVNSEHQARTKREIASAMAAIGDFNAAINTANSIELARYRQQAMSAISIAYAKQGRIADATKLLGDISDAEERANAQEAVAVALAHEGRIEEAAIFLVRIEEKEQHRKASLAVSQAFARKGQIEKAILLAGNLDEFWNAVTLSEISKIQTEFGDFEGALKTAKMINHVGYLADAVVEISIAAKYDPLLQQLITRVRSAEDLLEKRIGLQKIATRTGNPEILAESRRLEVAAGGFDIWFAAMAEIEAGLYSEARRTAQKEPNKYRKSEIHLRISIAEIENGLAYQARKNLGWLLPNQELQIRSMLWSAEGNSEDLRRAIRLANENIDDSSRSSAMRDIVCRVSDLEKLEEVQTIAARIRNRVLRDGAFECISETLAQRGQKSEALRVIHQISMDNRISTLLAVEVATMGTR